MTGLAKQAEGGLAEIVARTFAGDGPLASADPWYVEREVPRSAPLLVAGDLNDWGGKLRPAMNLLGLKDHVAASALTGRITDPREYLPS